MRHRGLVGRAAHQLSDGAVAAAQPPRYNARQEGPASAGSTHVRIVLAHIIITAVHRPRQRLGQGLQRGGLQPVARSRVPAHYGVLRLFERPLQVPGCEEELIDAEAFYRRYVRTPACLAAEARRDGGVHVQASRHLPPALASPRAGQRRCR